MVPDRLRFSLTLLTLAAAFGAVFLLVRPAISGVIDVKQNVYIEKQKLERVQAINENFQKIQQSLAGNAELVSRSEKALPSLTRETNVSNASDVPQLLELLQDMGSREAPGVLIRSARIAGIEGEGSTAVLAGTQPWEVKSRSVVMDGVASYDGLKRLLSATASSLRIVEPKTLTFTVDAEHNIVNFNFVVDAYAQLGCRRANCQTLSVGTTAAESR